MFKSLKTLFLTLTILSLSACGDPSASIMSQETPETKIEVEKTKALSSQVTADWAVKDFVGKPSVIVFGGTYCPHCRTAVPVFEKEVVQKYNDKANIWVQVIDGKDGKKFQEVDIPQGYNPNLTFEKMAQKSCGYVPSWVVLNASSEPVLSSCGSEKEIGDMVTALESLLKI